MKLEDHDVNKNSSIRPASPITIKKAKVSALQFNDCHYPIHQSMNINSGSNNKYKYNQSHLT